MLLVAFLRFAIAYKSNGSGQAAAGRKGNAVIRITDFGILDDRRAGVDAETIPAQSPAAGISCPEVNIAGLFSVPWMNRVPSFSRVFATPSNLRTAPCETVRVTPRVMRSVSSTSYKHPSRTFNFEREVIIYFSCTAPSNIKIKLLISISIKAINIPVLSFPVFSIA